MEITLGSTPKILFDQVNKFFFARVDQALANGTAGFLRCQEVEVMLHVVFLQEVIQNISCFWADTSHVESHS